MPIKKSLSLFTGCFVSLLTVASAAAQTLQPPEGHYLPNVPPGYSNPPLPAAAPVVPVASSAAYAPPSMHYLPNVPPGYAAPASNDAIRNSDPSYVPPRSGHFVYYYAPGAVEPVLVRISDPPAAPPQAAPAAAPSVQASVAPIQPLAVVNVSSSVIAAPPPLPPPPPPLPVEAASPAVPASVEDNSQNIVSASASTFTATPPSPVRTASPQEKPLLDLAPPYMDLSTRQGIDIGAQGFYYRYREPDLDVTELGDMVGVLASGTMTFGGGFFGTLDGRYAFGDLDYRGSGTASDKWNDLWEVRGLIGKDFVVSQYILAPFTGIGFRDLFDDNRGLTTIDAFGYRRENQIYYLPLGVMPRMHLDGNSRLTSLFEYDVLLHGEQTSYLSDGGTGDPNIENQQHSGFGIRANVMYETPWWSIGPFINYWDIDQSKTKFFLDPSASTCASFSISAPCVLEGDEPKNHTYEVGIQFKVHFL